MWGQRKKRLVVKINEGGFAHSGGRKVTKPLL